MAPSGWIEILANIGLCAMIVGLWTELVHRHAFRWRSRTRAALLGLVMGGGAVAGMVVPYHVAPGVFFDLRTAMVALAGFFGGPVAGLIAAAAAMAYRGYMGGAGAVPGCIGIALAAGIGHIGYLLCRDRAVGYRHLVGLAACVAVTNLLTALLLPRAVWTVLLPDFGPVLFAAILATVALLGAALLTVQRREELATVNTLYRAMVEALPDSLNVKSVDGRFMAANAATARLMDAGGPERLIGKTDFDFYPSELAQRYRADELVFLEKGGPVVIDQPGPAADGSDRWLSTVKAPFHDERGRLAGIVTHNRDITERKRLELELTGAHKMLDDALESMADGFALYDAEDRLVRSNRRCRELFPRSAELQVPGIGLADLTCASIEHGELKGVGHDDVSAWVARYSPRQHPEGRHELELADGRWVEQTTRPTDGGGRIVLYRDITERKLNEIELIEARDAATVADRAKSEFLAVMSHEIRTPLTAVIGIADILGERDLDVRSKYYVDGIRRSGKQLLAIVNDVLDFLRLGAGRLQYHEIDFNLQALLEETRSTFHPMALERGIGLDVAPPSGDPAPLRGDPVRLRQVLFNFVSNSIKFTDCGRVQVSAAVEAQTDGRYRLRVEVEDTGLGIPAEQLPRLFHAFTQVDSTASRPFSGAGLGLAICKQLIEGMGGQIGCESRVGEGSRFWFEVTLEEGADVIETGVEAADAVSLRPLNILLAEDAPLNREILTDVLTGRGHLVALAENGAEFLREAAARPFDALIVDIQMPVMDGEQAIRRLRRGDGCNGRTPALALTANVMAPDRSRYIAGGFDAVLHKPIVWDELFAELGRVTGRGGRADGLAESAAPYHHQMLVDRATMERIASLLSNGSIEEMLRQALAEARDGLTELSAANLDARGRARVAHRLTGTLRTLGLTGLGAAAEAVEAAGNTARPDEELRLALKAYARVLEATIKHLEREGFSSLQQPRFRAHQRQRGFG